jgi:hypothetical protein
MKKKLQANALIFISFLALLFFISCSGDDVSLTGFSTGEFAPRQPAISSMGFAYLSPTSAFVYEGGGAVTAVINFYVLDNDEDLKEAYVIAYDGGGNITNKIIIDKKEFGPPIYNPNPPIGSDPEPIWSYSIAVPVDTSAAGIYTLVLSVADIQGNVSNSLSSTFLIS